MAKVSYRWSKDGKADLCDRQEITTKGEHLCYHCGTLIFAGSTAALLLTDRGEKFLLHESCADESCTAVKEVR